MFNGIIRQTGSVKNKFQQGKKAILTIEARSLFTGTKIGDSVAVNGVCLTISGKKGRTAVFDVVSETLTRTALGQLVFGSEVNLELPLEWKERVSGHFVLGHIDGTGCVQALKKTRSQSSFLISFPKGQRRFIVEKGSIAVDGVSLTIGKVSGNSFWVHIIPHTLQATGFKHLRPGSRVNLEVDYLAKLALS